jgi:hypothetical protein
VLIGFLFTFLLGVRKLYTGDGVSTICIVLTPTSCQRSTRSGACDVRVWPEQQRGFCDSLFYGVDSVIGYPHHRAARVLGVSILQMRSPFNDSVRKERQLRQDREGDEGRQDRRGGTPTRCRSAERVAPGVCPITGRVQQILPDVRSAVRSEHRYM